MVGEQSVQSREQQETRLRRSGTVVIDVSDDDDLSDSYIMEWAGNVAVHLPALTSTNLKFLVQANEYSDFVPLYSDAGPEISIPVTTGTRAMVVRDLAGWWAFKIVTTVGQAADREISVIVWDD